MQIAGGLLTFGVAGALLIPGLNIAAAGILVAEATAATGIVTFYSGAVVEGVGYAGEKVTDQFEHHQIYVEIPGYRLILSFNSDNGLEVITDMVYIDEELERCSTREEVPKKGTTWLNILIIINKLKERNYHLKDWNCQHYAKYLLERIAN